MLTLHLTRPARASHTYDLDSTALVPSVPIRDLVIAWTVLVAMTVIMLPLWLMAGLQLLARALAPFLGR